MLPRLFFGLVTLALVASGSSRAATFALYRSTDDGHSWTKAGRGIPPDLRTDALGEIGAMRLAGTERGLFVSGDDGQTWTRPLRSIPEDVKVTDFAVSGGRVYGATTRGVWISADDGGSWASVGGELVKTKILSLTVAGGRIYAGTDGQGAWALREPAIGWEKLGAGLPERAQLFQFAVRDGSVFAALYVQGVYRFDSTARRWLPTAAERPLRLVSAEGILFAGRNPGGVFTSHDGGNSWENASAGLPDNAPTWCLASLGSTVLIGTRGESCLLRYEPLFQSWRPSDKGLPAGGSPIAFHLQARSFLVSILTAGTEAPIPRK